MLCEPLWWFYIIAQRCAAMQPRSEGKKERKKNQWLIAFISYSQLIYGGDAVDYCLCDDLLSLMARVSHIKCPWHDMRNFFVSSYKNSMEEFVRNMADFLGILRKDITGWYLCFSHLMSLTKIPEEFPKNFKVERNSLLKNWQW